MRIKNDIEISWHPVAIYFVDEKTKSMNLFIGYPVPSHTIVVGSDYEIIEIGDTAMLFDSHFGEHTTLVETHKRIQESITLKGLDPGGCIVEEFVSSTITEPDPTKLETRIYYFVTNEGAVAKKKLFPELKKTLLVLEDEQMLSNALKNFLDKYEFTVYVAGNGDEAAELIKLHTFDLALLDLLVPGEDGFHVLEKLKNRQPRTPVYILSNLEENENRKKALEMGADRYFVKSETLLSEVAEAIHESFSIKE